MCLGLNVLKYCNKFRNPGDRACPFPIECLRAGRLRCLQVWDLLFEDGKTDLYKQENKVTKNKTLSILLIIDNDYLTHIIH